MTLRETAILITTHNECETIGGLVLACQQYGRVYVVDDCSTDGTPRMAEEMGARVLSTTAGHPIGIGPSLLQGWRCCVEMAQERVVQLDAGKSHEPADIPWLVAPIEAGRADMVIGSRFRAGSSYVGNPRRAIASRLAAFGCNRAQVGAHWSDWTSGFRAFTVDALQTLLAHRYYARMHAWQIEVLAHAGADGLSITEVPIRYTAGRSSLDLAKVNEAFSVWLQVLHQYGPVRTDHAAAGFERERAKAS